MAAGAEITEIRAQPDAGFAWDIEAAVDVLRKLRPAIVYLGCPNNPTGVFLSREDVRRLAADLGDGVLVLDQAYVPFVEAAWPATRLAPNVAVLYSLTKDFALPGLRIGYMVASRAIIERVAVQQPSWSVSAPAQAAAVACLNEDAFLADSIAHVRAAKDELVEALTSAGFAVHAGAANFILVHVGNAALIRRRLLDHGLVVRDCASFGLPEYIRIGVRKPDECRRLVDALKELAG
jgi:histidinol-phosphate aminotransferase